MKVSVELNVSDKEFYDVMMKSLQEELNHVSKKKLKDWFQMNYMWQPLIQPLIIQRFHIKLMH